MPPNSLRPLAGSTATAKANLSKVYRHNNSACEHWSAAAKPKPRVALRIAAANRERLSH
jgi:hypothetical protein